MRVGVFHTAIGGPGGVETVCAETSRWLLAFGHTVDGYAASFGEDVVPGVVRHAVPALSAPHSALLGSFLVAGSLAVRSSGCTITHGHGNVIGCDVVTAHTCHRAGLVHAKRFFAASVGGRRNYGVADRIRLFVERHTYVNTTAVIAVSTAVKGELMEQYGLDDSSIDVIPNGVNTTRFAPDGKHRSHVREIHGIGTGDLVILFVGNEFARKGLDALLRALGSFRGERVTLMVCGGDRPEPYERLARSIGVEAQVKFCGLRSDIERYYNAGDLFVLPSFHEGCALVINEALASGLPVVTSGGVGGAGDIITDGTDGLLLGNPPDVPALVQMLRMLSDDPALRRRLGGEASRRAQQLSWEHTTRKIEAVYENVLRKNHAHR